MIYCPVDLARTGLTIGTTLSRAAGSTETVNDHKHPLNVSIFDANNVPSIGISVWQIEFVRLFSIQRLPGQGEGCSVNDTRCALIRVLVL